MAIEYKKSQLKDTYVKKQPTNKQLTRNVI